ncbi:MBL fold metallo-hydrolase [Elusimicrobiota bacterium]
MQIKILPVGSLATNCYVISRENVIVIDPGAEAEKIISEIEKLSLPLTHIIYTHAHGDHTGAAYDLKEMYESAEVSMGSKDVDLLQSKSSLDQLLGLSGKPAEPDRLLNEGDIIQSGSIELKVIETPGHTAGGISLYFEDSLFSGDTIFLNSIGRTDLAGGNLEDIKNSIINKIYKLDDNVKIYPGHGPPTNVGWEKKNNLYCAIQ